MKLDFGVSIEGFYGDSARTVPVGKVSEEAQQLIEATRESLRGGHRRHASPATASATSATRSSPTWRRRGSAWCGTSWGTASAGSCTRSPRCRTTGVQGHWDEAAPGMVLAIEPMVNAGSREVDVLDDDWTAVTLDGRLSAHFEHTIARDRGRAARCSPAGGSDNGLKCRGLGVEGLLQRAPAGMRGALSRARSLSVEAVSLPRFRRSERFLIAEG